MPTEANSINAATTGIVGNTGTSFTGTAVTAHNVIVGGSTSSTLTNVAPSATSGVPLVSGGASADPSFTTAVVAGGGTGQVTLTNHGVLVGAGTSAITQLAAGTAGQVLQSGGASADPAYSTATYPLTAGTSGNIITSNGTNFVSTSPATGGASWFLIQSQTASASSSITFTSGITATYNTYVLVISNYGPSAAQVLNMQVSNNGGSTYAATGYVGGFTNIRVDSATGWNNSSASTTNMRLGAPQATTQPFCSIILWLFSVTNGNEPSFLSHTVENGSGSLFLELCASSVATTTVNALKLSPSTGTITTGTFTLYGILE